MNAMEGKYLNYYSVIAAVTACFLCVGCAAKTAEPHLTENPTLPIRRVEGEWRSLSEYSPDIAQTIDRITTIGVKRVNYTVDNSICTDIDDQEDILALIDAIKGIEVGASTDMRKTDSGRRMIFYLKDGTQAYIGFGSDDYIEEGSNAYSIRGFEALKKIERDLY